MTDIPKDVMKSARAWADDAMMSAHSGQLLEPVRDAIARAILAERERCSIVAYDYASTYSERIADGIYEAIRSSDNVWEPTNDRP